MFLGWGRGTGVGFLSGVVGVGGGFLLTPLLFFIGIPPAVAVASQANQVVPTSIAYLRLGDVAVKQGKRQEAIQYYSTAAEAGGEVAEEAKRKLAQLTQN